MRRASERIFGVVFERENMLSVSVRKYEERNIMKTTLLIMAAGIGSRFGTGIKQLEPVDASNRIIMGPIAFILDFFIVSKLAFMCAARMVDFRNCHPFSKILAISVPSVAFMCPLMSLAATILFKNAGSQFIAVWIQTTAMNFPAAFFWQLIYAGPIVRFIFRHIFRENERVQDAAVSAE